MGGILLSSVLLELHKLSAAAASLKRGEAGNKARHGSFQRGAYMINLSQRMVSRRGFVSIVLAKIHRYTARSQGVLAKNQQRVALWKLGMRQIVSAGNVTVRMVE
ncbi:uncharacterized protein LOC124707117 isoform X1 [Lolium rigidum]|uniref:uncharacterized protein LOC124707117 isoform X1 n=1 Tax=Lolium rigidum TaxID=89674 RepID=UPI001F5C5F36|nr:uncharacterized protein LOC124707117 isoform X1 [Lolium rigidum]XP_051210351.1 uncharacterized protein LOC127327611 isoform X2 [Lolium perenne]